MEDPACSHRIPLPWNKFLVLVFQPDKSKPFQKKMFRFVDTQQLPGVLDRLPDYLQRL